ncbi:MAG: zf-HC2 domain-containing protein [Candidatus Velthaea sp.]|jgi:predicted anti-sigma-YlaC factor YlaD
MSCSSAEAVFERFLDGKLAAAQCTELLAHLDDCAGCRGVFEELRVVDALLNTPRQVPLAPNFTCATMSETRALRAPAPYRPPIRAYVVSYLAGAWLIAGAALLFAPQAMHALSGTVLDFARSIADAIGGLGSMVARLFGRGGNVLTALLGALLTLDVLLVAGFGLALKYVRPRLAERLRP